ncbi:prohormone-3 isoform X2 [Copidosoma floridanum]|uniref:prohormone-3 isoform X2 n=1 Tax=Copidosoma floridanum TaxID=29053 RepID=UPI000C6FBA3F|nr:prohormone-3 isoform X2 [Copidosoma floridanum]
MSPKLCVIAVVVIALSSDSLNGAEAWGGLFNRFSPDMLSNMGYGGGHGGIMSRPSAYLQAGSLSENNLDEGADEPCYERRCTTNEDCCSMSVCINFEDGEWPEGRCMFVYGLKQGELCRRDSDCETGLVCAELAGTDSLSCQPPVTSNKQYSEQCSMSSECDIGRGLCCQLQRRHRQIPRKMCSYFKDPLVCIGPVATDQVKKIVQYTTGEKRITGKDSRLYKQGFP